MSASPETGSGASRKRLTPYTRETHGVYLAALDETRRSVALVALEANDWNITLAASQLGIRRNMMHNLIRRFGLRRDVNAQ